MSTGPGAATRLREGTHKPWQSAAEPRSFGRGGGPVSAGTEPRPGFWPDLSTTRLSRTRRRCTDRRRSRVDESNRGTDAEGAVVFGHVRQRLDLGLQRYAADRRVDVSHLALAGTFRCNRRGYDAPGPVRPHPYR